jgi:hypothetical protein
MMSLNLPFENECACKVMQGLQHCDTHLYCSPALENFSAERQFAISIPSWRTLNYQLPMPQL